MVTELTEILHQRLKTIEELKQNTGKPRRDMDEQNWRGLKWIAFAFFASLSLILSKCLFTQLENHSNCYVFVILQMKDSLMFLKRLFRCGGYLSAHASIFCLFALLSLRLCHLSVCLSVCLPVCRLLVRSVCLSVCLSISMPVCPSFVRLPACLFPYLFGCSSLLPPKEKKCFGS